MEFILIPFFLLMYGLSPAGNLRKDDCCIKKVECKRVRTVRIVEE